MPVIADRPDGRTVYALERPELLDLWSLAVLVRHDLERAGVDLGIAGRVKSKHVLMSDAFFDLACARYLTHAEAAHLIEACEVDSAGARRLAAAARAVTTTGDELGRLERDDDVVAAYRLSLELEVAGGKPSALRAAARRAPTAAIGGAFGVALFSRQRRVRPSTLARIAALGADVDAGRWLEACPSALAPERDA